jgi:adenylate cyclase
VHLGVAFVGTIGDGDVTDFTALGDAVNTTARLASAAGSGEVLVTQETVDAAELDTTQDAKRTLELRGREAPVNVAVFDSTPLKRRAEG